jgi:two-component system, sensor histidine kinase
MQGHPHEPDQTVPSVLQNRKPQARPSDRQSSPSVITANQKESTPLLSRRILIVEDNRDGRESLCTLLQLLGHEVEVASDGLEGVRKALTWEPDVALVDIGLPLLDGYQVAQQLRSMLGNRVVLIAHTGYGRPEDRQRAFEAGFNAHLVKPLDIVQLTFLLGRAPAQA